MSSMWISLEQLRYSSKANISTDYILNDSLRRVCPPNLPVQLSDKHWIVKQVCSQTLVLKCYKGALCSVVQPSQQSIDRFFTFELKYCGQRRIEGENCIILQWRKANVLRFFICHPSYIGKKRCLLHEQLEPHKVSWPFTESPNIIIGWNVFGH